MGRKWVGRKGGGVKKGRRRREGEGGRGGGGEKWGRRMRVVYGKGFEKHTQVMNNL